jgi:hypothetical protein
VALKETVSCINLASVNNQVFYIVNVKIEVSPKHAGDEQLTNCILYQRSFYGKVRISNKTSNDHNYT